MTNFFGGATAFVFDDFNVGPGGATITGVFGNFAYLAGVPDQAQWEIRSGVSVADGGTLIASGTGTPTVSGSLVEVSGLNVNLTEGAYWLAIAPDVIAYLDTTSGANGVGTPEAQDGLSYFEAPGDDIADYNATSDFLTPDPGDGNRLDFSLGVIAADQTAVPEPASLWLLGSGLIAAARFRKAQRNRQLMP
jgi:hypothetical protein